MCCTTVSGLLLSEVFPGAVVCFLPLLRFADNLLLHVLPVLGIAKERQYLVICVVLQLTVGLKQNLGFRV